MKNILVLGGAGTMGQEAVKLLMERIDARIIVADANARSLNKVAQQYGPRIETAGLDVNDTQALIKLMQGADVALSTVGPFYKTAAAIISAAIDAKCSIVDIDDDYDATKACLDMDDVARKAGITAVIGMGASPGVTNLIAKLGAGRLDEVDSIRLYWAESAIDPTGPAAMAHWFHITGEKVPAFIDGQWVDVKGFSAPEAVEFVPPVGVLEVVYTGHPEPVSLPRYIKGVKNVSIKGALFPPKMMELYGMLIDTGFGSTENFNVTDSVSMPFRELAVRIVRSMPRFAPGYFQSVLEDALGKYEACAGTFRIVVSGKKNEKDTTYAYDLMAENVAHSTALPAVIAVQEFLGGKIKQKGVMAPEGALDASVVFDEIAKGAKVRETIIESAPRINIK